MRLCHQRNRNQILLNGLKNLRVRARKSVTLTYQVEDKAEEEYRNEEGRQCQINVVALLCFSTVLDEVAKDTKNKDKCIGLEIIP